MKKRVLGVKIEKYLRNIGSCSIYTEIGERKDNKKKKIKNKSTL
jgi:hypothetical protein